MTSNTEQDLQLGHHAGAPHFAPGNGEGYVSRMGLMAVTADMEHLRNHEGQDRNMTTPIAHCVRCQRPAPAEDDPDFLHWEVLDDVDMVCPECETPEEKQAIDEEDMRLADEVDD
jgi:hypothetical protein